MDKKLLKKYWKSWEMWHYATEKTYIRLLKLKQSIHVSGTFPQAKKVNFLKYILNESWGSIIYEALKTDIRKGSFGSKI